MDTCKDCGQEVGLFAELVKEKKIPFYCETCGALKIGLQATGDKVFMWPDPAPEYLGVIALPDKWQERHITVYGTVLSIGPGCVVKNKRFKPTVVPVGTYVLYDNTVPWDHEMLGNDGKMHKVKIMGELDIKGIITDDKNT